MVTPMTKTAFPLPAWAPLARTLIHRLVADRAEACDCTPPAPDAPWPWIGQKMAPRLSLSQTIFAPNTVDDDADETMRYLNQLTMEYSPEIGRTRPAENAELPEDPPEEAPREPQVLDLPPTDMLLTLRLAASLRDQSCVDQMLRPKMVFVLRNVPEADLSALMRLFKTLFLKGLRLAPAIKDHGTQYTTDVALVVPNRHEIGNRAGPADFLKRLTGILGYGLPTLILAPEGYAEDLPVTAVKFAPLTREVMGLQLALHWPADQVHAALTQLPTDADLGTLPAARLLLAFRQSTALAAAKSLQKLRPASKAGAKPAAVQPRLDQIAGYGAAGDLAKRMMADFATWQRGDLEWSDLTRSALFYGPPGTGKTWLAQAMGAEQGVNFVSASFARWQAAGHLGDMLREMRASFAEALAKAPSVLFIDEIDAVGSRMAEGHGNNRQYNRQVVNGFLELLDGADSKEGVLIIGACNDPSVIDPAVLRAGRFDRKVEVPLPGAEALASILRQHLPAGIAGEEDLETLTRAATGYSAAEAEALVREAKSAARQAGRSLQLVDILGQLAPPDPHRAAFDHQVAVHECGHAIMSHLTGHRVLSIRITPRGGETLRVQPFAPGTRTSIEDEMMIHLSGRVAEQLALGEVSTGSGGSAQDNDLAQATRLSLAIEHRWGLGHEGLVWTDRSDADLLRDPTIRRQTRLHLAVVEEGVVEELRPHLMLLRAMAACLIETRSLEGGDLEHWLSQI